MTVRVLHGDCRAVLPTLEAGSVQCVVTSPPYWGLRDYGNPPSIWGGDPACAHEWGDEGKSGQRLRNGLNGTVNYPHGELLHPGTGAFCRLCGAWRGCHGLEPTIDLFVQHEVEIFRAVRRVLRDDGTLWLNLGDSYLANKPSNDSFDKNGRSLRYVAGMGRTKSPGLKPKDLCMIPSRVALALQADGWWLRSEIIWCLSGGAWLYARTSAGDAPVMLKDLVRLKPETVRLWTGERWTPVIKWTRREGRHDAFEIVLRSGERVGCTGEHLWPTQRGNVRADELRKGDVIRSAKLPSSGRDLPRWLTMEACWFAGLYLAEGSRSGETIQIAGHARETERWDRIRDLAEWYGATARLYVKGNIQAIHIDGGALNAVLRTLIAGRTAKDKCLTTAAWQLSDFGLVSLANGYLEGDGHKDGGRIRLGLCRNYALERDLRCLAARLGATLTIKPVFAKNKQGRFPSFRGEWRWSRSGHGGERERGEVMEIRRSRARQFWDVTVADESSLFALASGVLTHNCKPNPMPESVRDRPTSAHEKIFLLTKSATYYYDAEAVREPFTESTLGRVAQSSFDEQTGGPKDPLNGNRSARKGLENLKAAIENGASGRNLRNVWTFATEPFPDSHFAVFPTELVRRCIRAGTSEKGCCSTCGAPWVRETEKPQPPADMRNRGADTKMEFHARQLGGGQKLQDWYDANPARTIGWSPSCACNAPTTPCVVLDPFGGAGTVGLVADRLQRSAILIEAKEEYCAMARSRLERDAPLFSQLDANGSGRSIGTLPLNDTTDRASPDFLERETGNTETVRHDERAPLLGVTA